MPSVYGAVAGTRGSHMVSRVAVGGQASCQLIVPLHPVQVGMGFKMLLYSLLREKVQPCFKMLH